jgi:hypothetical protein
MEGAPHGRHLGVDDHLQGVFVHQPAPQVSQ